MNLKQSLTRKEFLLKLTGFMLIPAALVWNNSIVKNLVKFKKTSIIRIPVPESHGIFFTDDVIIIKKESGVTVFSSRCTHLGCGINKFDNGQFVCPCHGSRYSSEGIVLQGPAVKPLERLQYRTDKEKNELVIDAAV